MLIVLKFMCMGASQTRTEPPHQKKKNKKQKTPDSRAYIVDWKKITMWELWVKFYLGQNEDYSLGDSVSDRSEELLQRSGGTGSQYICDFGEGGYMQ